jgi:oligoendopeptidase F
MNAPFKNPAVPEPPLWDLSDLYASRQDARIAEDLVAARAVVADLGALQGQLTGSRAEPAQLGRLLDNGAIQIGCRLLQA